MSHSHDPPPAAGGGRVPAQDLPNPYPLVVASSSTADDAESSPVVSHPGATVEEILPLQEPLEVRLRSSSLLIGGGESKSTTTTTTNRRPTNHHHHRKQSPEESSSVVHINNNNNNNNNDDKEGRKHIMAGYTVRPLLVLPIESHLDQAKEEEEEKEEITTTTTTMTQDSKNNKNSNNNNNQDQPHKKEGAVGGMRCCALLTPARLLEVEQGISLVVTPTPTTTTTTVSRSVVTTTNRTRTRTGVNLVGIHNHHNKTSDDDTEARGGSGARRILSVVTGHVNDIPTTTTTTSSHSSNNNNKENHCPPLIPLSDQIQRGMVRNILEPEHAMTIDSRAGQEGSGGAPPRRHRHRQQHQQPSRMEQFRRGLFRQRLVASLDSRNGILWAQQLQSFIPFVTGYEAYWISQVMEALDSFQPPPQNCVKDTRSRSRRILIQKELDFVLRIVFQNDHLLRILIEALRTSQGTPTHKFRRNHSRPGNASLLPLLHSFMMDPMSTMIHHGVVPVLERLQAHWHMILNQPSGSFTHHRLEQLDPFHTMRFYMPIVCEVLSNRRGRHRWDSIVLAPFLQRICQERTPPSENAHPCRSLAVEMKDRIVTNLTAGVTSVSDPLSSWLDAIIESCSRIENEALDVYQKVTSVELGIRLGHELITRVTWKIPDEADLQTAILLHLQGKTAPPRRPVVPVRWIRWALSSTTPCDKRTLVDLVKRRYETTPPAQLLLNRITALVKRRIRREALNEGIRQLSLGEYVTDLIVDDWYWLEEGGKRAVYIYKGKLPGTDNDAHRFIHADSGYDRIIPMNHHHRRIQFRVYIPVAESIARAQRCYMNLEVDHGKTFSFNALMQFSFLRLALRRLAVVSQLFCEELDHARLTMLREVQRRRNVSSVSRHGLQPVGRTYDTDPPESMRDEPLGSDTKSHPTDPEGRRTNIHRVPPQNMMILGNSLSGLLTVVHCTENVLMTGGVMKLLVDTNDAGHDSGQRAASIERARIVPLDPRWIALLRYHLGIGFEDAFLPASSDSDAQFGNSYTTSGFAEIAVKDLENILQFEVSRMWSKGVIQCFPNKGAKYDPKKNALTKQGQYLTLDDTFLCRVDPDGNGACEGSFPWKVVEVMYQPPLGLDDLKVGREYSVFIRQDDSILPFRLTGVDIRSRTYTFKALRIGDKDLKATAHNLPFVYPKGARKHRDVTKIIVESAAKRATGASKRLEMKMSVIRSQIFTLVLGPTHVVDCTSMSHDSNCHLNVTTKEPYGMCSISGLKVSMVMHNFGQNRYGAGLLRDFRSVNDKNTRMVGNTTKQIHQPAVAQQMLELMRSDHWQSHFNKVIEDSKFPSLNSVEPIVPKLRRAVLWHAMNAKWFKRQTLQFRFFETTDNLHLCTELTREYEEWKTRTADDLVSALKNPNDDKQKKEIGCLRDTLCHHIDRLWYESCLEVIRRENVSHSRTKKGVVSQIHMISSRTPTELQNLQTGERFKIKDTDQGEYDILVKTRKLILVRNSEGYVSKMAHEALALKQCNLSRAPEGNDESDVVLSAFSVVHRVNFRSLRMNHQVPGYIFAFIGDQQSAPNIMENSSLTGTCINTVLINDFVGQSLSEVPFTDRCASYSNEIDWSNCASCNCDWDTCLRPNFAYRDGIDYLHSKVLESMETCQDLDDILSSNWKDMFAMALIPKGMELEPTFIRSLYQKSRGALFDKFLEFVKEDDELLKQNGLVDSLLAFKDSMSDTTAETGDDFWSRLANHFDESDQSTDYHLRDYHVKIAEKTDQTVRQIVQHAVKSRLYDKRGRG